MGMPLFIQLLPEKTPDSYLEKMIKRGTLKVLTRNGPTTYYQNADGATGLEYDLATLFADRLGVELELVIPDSFMDLIPMLIKGEADLAAAGLTVTESRKEVLRFAPSYQNITQQLVYRSGNKRPKSFQHIAADASLEVMAGSSHVEQLLAAQKEHLDLTWSEHEEIESEELLSWVHEGLIDYTIADSNEVSVNRRFYPELLVGFNITQPEKLAWAFNKDTDDSLYQEAVKFFAALKKSGQLKQLIDRHYAHVKKFDYSDVRLLSRHYANRLPQYRDFFIAAGKKYDLDWRLLAAIGYQESHWNEKARSPTGVRGIMMLTQATANHLKISNRVDPQSSILGGARWLHSIKKRIPEDISEPDRTWMAMASYNVGLGHLEDARVITQQNKGDPDKWIDVKKSLPLLSRKTWYQNTKYGYARGWEPVKYVARIRSYYELLIWLSEKDLPEKEKPNPDLFTVLPAGI